MKNSIQYSFFVLLAFVMVDLCVAQSTAAPDQIEGQIVDDSQPAKTQEVEQAVGKKQKKADKEKPAMLDFMRITKDSKRKPVAFESSITRYLGKNDDKKIAVDLIGVVHIGEKAYYEKLNEIFEDYDVVLYELVAPEGTVIPEGGGERPEGFNPIAAMQMGMQSALGLEFQLKHINYEKQNFVHADMSPEEFMESMKNNDESFGKMALKAMGQSMAQSGGGGQMSNFDLLKIAFAKDKELKMRQVFAKQMVNVEGGMAMFEGADGSTIINHRNGKVMEILDREIASGNKKIAIFYGAGHLPDMQRRLQSDFKMQRAGQYWLEAWKLKR